VKTCVHCLAQDLPLAAVACGHCGFRFDEYERARSPHAYGLPYQQAPAPPPQTIVIIQKGPPKSVAAAFFLAFLFGPLGMLYSTPIGALVMFLVYIVVGIATAGVGLMVAWPVCMVWACKAASESQRQ
jgi:hypothetical protein